MVCLCVSLCALPISLSLHVHNSGLSALKRQGSSAAPSRVSRSLSRAALATQGLSRVPSPAGCWSTLHASRSPRPTFIVFISQKIHRLRTSISPRKKVTLFHHHATAPPCDMAGERRSRAGTPTGHAPPPHRNMAEIPTRATEGTLCRPETERHMREHSGLGKLTEVLRPRDAPCPLFVERSPPSISAPSRSSDGSSLTLSLAVRPDRSQVRPP